MEKIRRLSLLLQSGIEDYEEAVKSQQSERLKYMRLSMSNGFGTGDGDSKTSWLQHLQTLELGSIDRLNALRQAIVNAAVDIQADLDAHAKRKAAAATAPIEPDDAEDLEPPSEADKV